jgi:hypothetical protein
MSVATRTAINPSIRWNLSGEGGVLLDLKRGKYYNLNGMGVMIWRQLVAGGTVDDVVADLHARYQTPVEQLTGDVRAFMGSLLAKGILHHAD